MFLFKIFDIYWKIMIVKFNIINIFWLVKWGDFYLKLFIYFKICIWVYFVVNNNNNNLIKVIIGIIYILRIEKLFFFI